MTQILVHIINVIARTAFFLKIRAFFPPTFKKVVNDYVKLWTHFKYLPAT